MTYFVGLDVSMKETSLTAADLPVICVETRHMKALLTAQQINKTNLQ